jgi:hypothetical protein
MSHILVRKNIKLCKQEKTVNCKNMFIYFNKGLHQLKKTEDSSLVDTVIL